MIIHTDDNLFAIRGDNYVRLFLTDTNLTLSGAAMKMCHHLAPSEITTAKAKGKLNVGDVVYGGRACSVFAAAKANYRQKYNPAVVEQIWKELLPQLVQKGYASVRVDIEDYPWLENIIQKYDRDDITIYVCHHCVYGRWYA